SEASKKIFWPSCAIAESGAVRGRTRWTGFGFAPGPCVSTAETAPAANSRPAPRSHEVRLFISVQRSQSLRSDCIGTEALDSCFDAFSSREPVPTSLENALVVIVPFRRAH